MACLRGEAHVCARVCGAASVRWRRDIPPPPDPDERPPQRQVDSLCCCLTLKVPGAERAEEVLLHLAQAALGALAALVDRAARGGHAQERKGNTWLLAACSSTAARCAPLHTHARRGCAESAHQKSPIVPSSVSDCAARAGTAQSTVKSSLGGPGAQGGRSRRDEPHRREEICAVLHAHTRELRAPPTTRTRPATAPAQVHSRRGTLTPPLGLARTSVLIERVLVRHEGLHTGPMASAAALLRPASARPEPHDTRAGRSMIRAGMVLLWAPLKVSLLSKAPRAARTVQLCTLGGN